MKYIFHNLKFLPENIYRKLKNQNVLLYVYSNKKITNIKILLEMKFSSWYSLKKQNIGWELKIKTKNIDGLLLNCKL